jgi:hypothetical protein
MLAMKCMAMRTEGIQGSQDIDDIRNLIRIAEMKTAREVLDLVEEKFYPRSLIPPKVVFGVEETMETLSGDSEDAG